MSKINSSQEMAGEWPLVCICIPTYNAAATIRETLASIQSQTYPNLIVHVSDNASTDDTLRMIDSIADSRVRVHRLERNVGAEGNFNRCIELAEGDYAAIFHADDLYESDMVAKQVAFLQGEPEAAAVFTGASLIDEMGKQCGQIGWPASIASDHGLYDFGTMFKAVLQHSNFFICPSAMVRTSVYQREITSWRGESFKSSADLDVWLRILQHHSIGYLTEPLMRYRLTDKQGSAEVRSATERADFFLVIDHYLTQESVLALLNDEDWRNYRWLERRDRLVRAINLYIADNSEQAVGLLHDLYSRDALNAAFKSKRGMFVLLSGIMIRLSALFGLTSLCKPSLVFVKRLFRK